MAERNNNTYSIYRTCFITVGLAFVSVTGASEGQKKEVQEATCEFVYTEHFDNGSEGWLTYRFKDQMRNPPAVPPDEDALHWQQDVPRGSSRFGGFVFSRSQKKSSTSVSPWMLVVFVFFSAIGGFGDAPPPFDCASAVLIETTLETRSTNVERDPCCLCMIQSSKPGY